MIRPRSNSHRLRSKALALLLLLFLPAALVAQTLRTFRFDQRPETNPGLLALPQNSQADIKLTQVPGDFFLEGDKRTRFVSWEPADVRCILRYGASPGNLDLQNNYPNTLKASGAGTLPISAFDENLGPGIYYCVLVAATDSSRTSVEFRIIVQAKTIARAVSPLGRISLRQGSPLFRWDPVVGVPYYFILLSEGALSIERDPDGTIRGLTGLNLTWAAITPESFIKYGDPDPAGNFINENVPPLLPGITYNWAVFNSYGPDPNMISIDVAPVAPFFFEVTRPTLPQQPMLNQPTEGSLISSETIDFSWSAVPQAKRYRFFLNEKAIFQSSSAQFVVWSQTTRENRLKLDTRHLLVKSDYTWRVVAEDGDKLSASSVGSFKFDGAAGWATFVANSPQGRVPRVKIIIKSEVDSPTLIPALTDTFGLVEDLPLPAGAYRFTASRRGFESAPPTSFTVNSGETAFQFFNIIRGASALSGRVIDETGAGIFNALIEARSTQGAEQIHTDENGAFALSLRPGTWTLTASKRDFVKSEGQEATLPNEGAVDVGNILLKTATNIVSGQALFAEDRRPLQGSLVRAQSAAGIFETTTSNQGGYRFALGPGTWRISIDSQGFFATPADYSLQLTENLQVPASFQLFDDALVYGKVAFQTLPLSEATVEAVDKSSGKIVQSAPTNTQGAYTLGLPAGEYQLFASHAGFLGRRRDVSVGSGQTLVEDFSLTESASVQGKVVNLSTGQPAANASIFTLEDTTLQTKSGKDGDYSLSVPPGISLRIDARLPGFESSGPIGILANAGEVLTGNDFFMRPLSGIIRGRVTDGFTPLPGASVSIPELSLSALTDDSGRFSFEVAPGDFTIETSMICHISNITSAHLEAGQTLNLEIKLRALSSEINGRVRDGSGFPVAKAEVSAVGDTTFTTLSDSAGAYRLCLSSGIFRVAAAKPGYFRADTVLVVNEGDLHQNIDFTLRASFARLSGVVRDTSGAPLAGARVELEQEQNFQSATTDSGGRYEIHGIVPGAAQLRAVKPGFYSKKQSLFLRELESARADLTLYPADGFVRGIALNARDNTPIAGVTVSAQFSIDSELFYSATTDAAGVYALENLPVVQGASFQVFAFKEEYFSPAPITGVNVFSEGVDFLLVSKTGVISGQVNDVDTETPIAGARVEALNSRGSRGISFSDSAGTFVLLNLAPNDVYEVKAEAIGYFPKTASNIATGSNDIRINLARKYGFVSGRIRDLQSGLAAAGVPVVATPLGADGLAAQVATDDSGAYIMRLVPDFYAIAPALSHYRSDPPFSQLEIAEVDTARGVDFSIEAQTVASIQIQRADRTEQPIIANGSRHCYLATARDQENRPVNIGLPEWSVNVSERAAVIDGDGCLSLDPAYFGDLAIQARDRLSNVSGRLQLQVFARIDSNTAGTFFDDRGLQMQISQNAVLSRRDLLVSRIVLAPAKKNRSSYLTGDYSFVIKPAGLIFADKPRLSLPPPANTDGQDRFVARWDEVRNEWEILATTDEGSALAATIQETGEYVGLAASEPLGISRLALLPNPFSPRLRTDGLPGLQIRFDLASSASPTPLITVKIYNLEGNLVRLLHDQTPFPRGQISLNWDGKADSGALARNGRYLIRIVVEDPGGRQEKMKSVVLIK